MARKTPPPTLKPPIPRSARTPHTSKPPVACPHCGGTSLTRRGLRKKKFEIVQLWACHACKRVFTPNPQALRNKTYPLRVILAALTDYNLGYSLEETAARLGKSTHRRVSPTTINNWLEEYKAHTTYRRLRPSAKHLFSPITTIRKLKLYHRQVYECAYHRSKLALLQQFPPQTASPIEIQKLDLRHIAVPVAQFLESIPTSCPHDLFTTDTGARGSQVAPDFIDKKHLIVIEKQNAATEAAALIIPSVGSNYQRHPSLQKFMLANDSVTVAIEIPVWLDDDEITRLEDQHSIDLIPYPRDLGTGAPSAGKLRRSFTGHIDFLQIRNGALHILDYKPGARTDKPLAQLTLYALALTKRIPGLRLFDIKCAWFDEHVYNEFFPRTVLKHKIRNST